MSRCDVLSMMESIYSVVLRLSVTHKSPYSGQFVLLALILCVSWESVMSDFSCFLLFPVKKSFLGFNKSLWGPLELVEKLCPEAAEISASVRDLPGLK